MDAAWLLLAIAATGVTPFAQPTEAQPLNATLVGEEAVAARGSIDADLLPRKHSERRQRTFAERQVVYQPITASPPITTGQLESGFSQATQQINTAGQSLNQFGQTLQQGSTDAQRAFATTQQQFAESQFLQPAGEAPRTIGGELREGASRLFGRAKSAIGKTGEAIGGTARNLRDALPGRRNQPAAPATVSGVNPGAFQPFNYQNPTPPAGGFVAGPGSAPVVTPTIPAANNGIAFPAASAAEPITGTRQTGAASGFATSTPTNGGARSNFGDTNPAAPGNTTLTPVAPPQIATTIASGNRDPFGAMQPPLASVPPPTPNWTNPPQTDYRQPFKGPSFDYRNNNQRTDPLLANDRRDATGGLGVPATGGLGAPGTTSAVISVLDNPATTPTRPSPPANQQAYPAWNQPAPGVVATGAYPQQQADPYRQTVALPTAPFTQPTTVAGPGADQFPTQGYPNPAPPLAAPGGVGNPQQHQTTGQFVTTAGRQDILPPGEGRDPREPWKELVFATVVALGSVGGNLFLGWSYLDARNKYRTALRRTSRTFRPGSALADD